MASNTLLLGSILLLCLFPANNVAQSPRNEVGIAEQRLLNELFSGYDKTIRAFSHDSNATTVHINMYVRSIHDVNEVSMDFDTQLTFRMQWQDTRLAYQGKKDMEKFGYLTLTHHDAIWIPDVFFSNEKSGHAHSLLAPNIFVRIFPDGQILYSARISLKLACPMTLRTFPFDSQICSIRMASYAYTADDIILKWKKHEPVQLTPALHLPQWVLRNFNTETCDSKTITGVYSCLRVDFNFSREFRHYFISIFIPCTMLVIIGWLTLWLEHHGPGANGRLIMSVLTLLIMSVLVQQFNSHTTPVSYTKAMDMWTGVCLTFVFSTLTHFVIVNYLARNRGCSSDNIKSQQRLIEGLRDWRNNLPDALDTIMRIAYPIAFILFAFIYFSMY